MNRKLHNSMLAFSVTGLMLTFGLMTASPVAPDAAADDIGHAAQLASSDDSVPLQARAAATEARTRAIEARIEARARVLEAELEHSASLGDTIASAVNFAAAVSTEAAINAAFEASDAIAEERTEASRERRHKRRVRNTLAVPYFSFAQGLRRGSGS